MGQTQQLLLAVVMVLDADQVRQLRVHQILEEEVAALITCRQLMVLLVDQAL
jgi:hypothetical protein